MTFHRRSCLAVLVMLAACRNPKISNDSKVVIDSSGAFPVITAPREVPEWRAEPIIVVATAGGESGEFGSIRSILLAPDGTLYVVDPSKRALSIFDSTGRFIRVLGREGSGPGEYREPYSIAWMGKSLAVLDPRNGRLGLYDSTGHWLTSWPVWSITGGQFIRLYRTAPTVWLYGAGPKLSDGVFIRYTASGPQDTLPLFHPPEPLSRGRKCQGPDQGTNYFPQPFGTSLLQIPAGGSTRALALSTAYRIALVDAKGDTLRLIVRDPALAPISDLDWAEANVDWVKFRQEWPTAVCDLGEFSRPAVKPPIVHLFIDDIGRLWVERATPNGPQYDVFSQNGLLIATVVGLPASEGIDPTVAGGRIALVSHDSTDSPVVRVFRFLP